jgi:hypothetical protein
MSKEPIKIPVGLQIFKDLTAHGKQLHLVLGHFVIDFSGYWQSSRWPKLPMDKQTKVLGQLTQWKENDEVSLNEQSCFTSLTVFIVCRSAS